MHKVKNRAFIVLVLAAILTAGIVWYIALYVQNGATWVAFPSNRYLYSGGTITTGTVLDRNGTVLAGEKDGSRVWADSKVTRLATLHLLGDPSGNIGTGVLHKFGSTLIGYNLISGLFNKESGTLHLTVDADICDAAYAAMGDYNGAVIAYNYKTGAVLCMVSKPTYDPANPPENIADNPAYEGVYINRTLSATYTPGSTMKIVTLAAAIEHISDLSSRTYTCTGSYQVDGTTITCPHAHGTVTIAQAFAKSCNCTFAQLALELGGKTLQSYMTSLRLNRSLSIDGISTAAGHFDASADGSSALAWSGIGQSTDLVCAANMMVLAGAVGNGGTAVMPSLLGNATEHANYFSASTAAALEGYMRNAVSSVYGDYRFSGLNVCAKSGTAQVGESDSHAWFVGYCADDAYPCAFAVILEHGGAGSAAGADVAAAILKAVKDG